MNQFEKEMLNIQQKEAINEFMDSFENTLRFIGIAAKTQKAYFDGLVKEGFTEDQALEIIKIHGMDVGRAGHARNNDPEDEN